MEEKWNWSYWCKLQHFIRHCVWPCNLSNTQPPEVLPSGLDCWSLHHPSEFALTMQREETCSVVKQVLPVTYNVRCYAKCMVRVYAGEWACEVDARQIGKEYAITWFILMMQHLREVEEWGVSQRITGRMGLRVRKGTVINGNGSANILCSFLVSIHLPIPLDLHQQNKLRRLIGAARSFSRVRNRYSITLRRSPDSPEGFAAV